MLQALQITTLMLVAAAWAFALAHAAEMPGKMRLDRNAYLAVQQIYYPGFTLGGVTEPLAIVALALLLAVAPAGVASAWVAVALVATVATQLVYWLVTHPVNRRWVSQQRSAALQMGKAGSAFFGTGKAEPPGDWKRLRDRWERSHVARAALMTGALFALAVALTGAG